ncbi:MAG: bacterial Ig-like domain-containing protein, partial [Lactobacillaceae bacterium]
MIKKISSLFTILLLVTLSPACEETVIANTQPKQAALLSGGQITESGTFGTSKWTLDSNGKLIIQSGELGAGAFGGGELQSSRLVKEVVFDGEVYANSDSSSLFQAFTSGSVLFVNLNNLNTSNVTDMSDMFANVSPAQGTLDLSSFDTSNVTNMSEMFSSSGAAKINLSSFDMSNVSNKNRMFVASKPKVLVLGSKVILDSSVMLSEITENTTYTGKWINVGNGSESIPSGNNLWTSDELVKYFNTANADTYVWQEKGSISVKYFDIDTGKIIPSSILPVNPEITNGLVGEKYTISEKNIENYTFIKYTDPTTKETVSNTGIYENGQKSIYAFYQKKVDKTAVNVHDSILYIGQDANWTPDDNFDTAFDKDGNSVLYSQITVDDSQMIDPEITTPGEYDIKYSYGGVTSVAHVSVREQKEALNVHNSTINLGDSWKSEDNFDSALDIDGNQVSFDQVNVNGTVDTTKIGSYNVVYSFLGLKKT